MKTNRLLFLSLFLLSFFIRAQDTIVLKTGERFSAKVIEIGVNEVKYKKATDGPMYISQKSEITLVKYENGSSDDFSVFKEKEIKQVIASTPIAKADNINWYEKGQNDALKYYTPRLVGAGGTLATTLVLSPIIGLIPGAICSAVPPNRTNFNNPDPLGLAIPEYVRGYQNVAGKMKRKKIWTFFGAGSAAYLLLYLMLPK